MNNISCPPSTPPPAPNTASNTAIPVPYGSGPPTPPPAASIGAISGDATSASAAETTKAPIDALFGPLGSIKADSESRAGLTVSRLLHHPCHRPISPTVVLRESSIPAPTARRRGTPTNGRRLVLADILASAHVLRHESAMCALLRCLDSRGQCRLIFMETTQCSLGRNQCSSLATAMRLEYEGVSPGISREPSRHAGNVTLARLIHLLYTVTHIRWSWSGNSQHSENTRVRSHSMV